MEKWNNGKDDVFHGSSFSFSVGGIWKSGKKETWKCKTEIWKSVSDTWNNGKVEMWKSESGK